MANRVLITGASGFVGSFVVRRALQRGWDVAVLLRNPENARRIVEELPHLTVIQGDLARFDLVAAEAAAFEPSAVIHLAWQGVQSSDRNDLMQVDNVVASLALLRWAHKAGVAHFIGLGSQAEYGPCLVRIDESVPTRPTTLYGAAKLSTYVMSDRIAEQLGLAFAWLRLFSSYGPDDDPNRLFPYLIDRLLCGERPALTKAEQLWDFIFVEDVADALLAVVESRARGVFNLGSGTAPSLRTMIEAIRDRIDPSLELGFGEAPYRPDQVMCLQADISALTQATGWTPKVGISEGVARMIAWRRGNEK
ncbi:CDP-abequose synthase [Azospirillaceae bacterium]